MCPHRTRVLSPDSMHRRCSLFSSSFFLLLPPPSWRCALIAKLFRRISTVSRKISNQESTLPLCVSFFFTSFSLFLSPELLVSFCSGRHFLSTQARLRRDLRSRSLYGFVPREKEEKKDARKGERKREKKRGKGQKLPMGERASSRNEKDEIKCETARAQRRMMIDRLSQSFEFDFSFRRREKYILYIVSFLHFFFLLVFFFSWKSRHRVFRLRARYCRIGFWRFSRCARPIAVEGCHRERMPGGDFRPGELSRRFGFSMLHWEWHDGLSFDGISHK